MENQNAFPKGMTVRSGHCLELHFKYTLQRREGARQ